MKIIKYSLALASLAIPVIASSQVTIVREPKISAQNSPQLREMTDSERAIEAEEKYQANRRAQIEEYLKKPLTPHFPTLDNLIEGIVETNKSIKRSPVHRSINKTASIPPPISRTHIIKSGCQLVIETPSGVAKVSGGLNGSQSIYKCDGILYLAAYEWDYSEDLTQKITIYDSEYADNPSLHRRRVKESTLSSSDIDQTTLSWINERYEIRYEIHTAVKNRGNRGAIHQLRRTLEESIHDALEGD